MLNYSWFGSIFLGLLISFGSNGPNAQDQPLSNIPSEINTDSVVYKSENLLVRKISKHVYEHISFLETESFGKVSCNGIVVMNQNEAVVFDTPANEESSKELINFFGKQMKSTINAVIATHFHADCIAGLKEFHKHQISSYANNRTIAVLEKQKDKPVIPQKGFDDILELHIGDKKVYAEYFGEGHTKDNIIGYFPEDKLIFGGCLVKEYAAKKGNLEDANVVAWPGTIKKIKEKYPQAMLIIPGHGKRGGPELLDYTIELFEQ